MFVTMRRYSPKNGAVNKASLELLRRQIQDEFLPIIEQVPGFRAYYVLNVDNREVVTLSFCDTQEGKAESSRCAADGCVSPARRTRMARAFESETTSKQFSSLSSMTMSRPSAAATGSACRGSG